MTTDTADDGLRARLSHKSEDALGRLAQELLESPLVSGALSRAFEAREKAAQAQELAMGALNLPSAGDLERLTRRVRSVSQRLEGVEDALDRIDERVGSIGGGPAAAGGVAALEQRLAAIEGQLTAFAGQLAELATRIAAQPAPAASPAPAAAEPPSDADAELVASVFDTPDLGGAEIRVAPGVQRATRTRAAAARKRAAARRRA